MFALWIEDNEIMRAKDCRILLDAFFERQMIAETTIQAVCLFGVQLFRTKKPVKVHTAIPN